ncbi:MAG: hypothetical protein JWR63_141 [Conexibacter sp.]|nr:hypothetical protein [Conexibacter sp.]
MVVTHEALDGLIRGVIAAHLPVAIRGAELLIPVRQLMLENYVREDALGQLSESLLRGVVAHGDPLEQTIDEVQVDRELFPIEAPKGLMLAGREVGDDLFEAGGLHLLTHSPGARTSSIRGLAVVRRIDCLELEPDCVHELLLDG